MSQSHNDRVIDAFLMWAADQKLPANRSRIRCLSCDRWNPPMSRRCLRCDQRLISHPGPNVTATRPAESRASATNSPARAAGTRGGGQ